MDKAKDYENSKIVVLGAAYYGYEVVQHDTELNNRVSEVEVPLLTIPEITKIIQKGAKALNIGVYNAVSDQIADYANCLATIAHQLAYNLCFNNGISKTQKRYLVINDEELEQAIKDFISEKQDTYKALYLKITQQRERTYKKCGKIALDFGEEIQAHYGMSLWMDGIIVVILMNFLIVKYILIA